MDRLPPLFSSATSRRKFLKTASGNFTALAAGSLIGNTFAEESAKPSVPAKGSESLVTEFWSSLKDHQKDRMVFPLDDPLRNRIENNWKIVKEPIGSLFDTEQQILIREIFLSLHSEEYRDKVWEQFISDNRGKNATTPDEIFGTASVAMFAGEGENDLEFVLTGRHCTRRCETGKALGSAAFGGPVFYGHAARGFYEKPDHPGNVYWYQALQANRLFKSLDEKQQKMALKGESRGESGSKTVALKGDKGAFEGLPVSELSDDQKSGVKEIISDLLLPFRENDQTQALAMIESQMDSLHLSYYEKEDVGEDKVWDNWQLEGPRMVWYFRGDPHVHVWVHVKDTEETA